MGVPWHLEGAVGLVPGAPGHPPTLLVADGEFLEHTITFENVQNVHVLRGPVQYLFGISTIVIETAGAAEGHEQNAFAVGNKAIMEGIDNPEEIRRVILERVRRSKSAGLGDERPASAPASPGWSPEHLRALRQVLEAVRALG